MNNKDIKKESKRIGHRYIILAIFVILFGLLIIGRLINLQIVHGKEYYEESTTRILASGKIYAPRGEILDRNGLPIAEDRLGFFLQYIDTKESDKEKNKMFLELKRILDKNGDKYKTSLDKYIQLNPDRFVAKNAKAFIKSIVINKADIEKLNTAREVFQYMREKTFKIDPQYTDSEAWDIMLLRYEVLCKKPTISNPILEFAEDISLKTVAEIEERSCEFPGITTYSKPIRYYINPQDIAHVLGYVRKINPEEYKSWTAKYPEKKYSKEDIVGKDGIERAAEQYLRGIDGIINKEVDYQGRIMAYWEKESAFPGQNVYLTIDLNLQKIAMKSLEKNIKKIRSGEIGGDKNFKDAYAGAVVAIDVRTGEILVMASYPSYNPEYFLENNDKEIIKTLRDPNKSMLNRATSEYYSPGSTFKPLVAIAALEEGIITPETKINCPAKEKLFGYTFKNLEGNQGKINLERALATSSNMFFYKLGIMTKIDNISAWAKKFGFGVKTGIEVYEKPGILSSKEVQKEAWVPANTAMSAIGQLHNRYTPLQLANYVSTIANGGKRFRPHLLKKLVTLDGDIKEFPIEYTQLNISRETIEAVKKGMVAVANAEDGTAVDAFRDFPFKVAGKTGTSETGYESNSSSHALFVCYAPADDPQIAVAVVIEHGVWGAYAAPVARDVLKAYFKLYGEAAHSDSIKEEKFEINW